MAACGNVSKSLGDWFKSAKALGDDTVNLVKISFKHKHKTKNRSKPMAFDIHKVTDKMLYQIALGESGKKDSILSKIKKDIINNPETYKKSFAALGRSSGKNVIFSDLDKKKGKTDKEMDALGQVVMMRSIAMNEIFSAMMSEAAIQESIGLTNESEIKSLLNDDGSRKLNKASVSQTVGKAIAEKLGFKISADIHVAKYQQQKLGDIALASLEEAGIIRTTKDDKILNNDFKDDNLKDMGGKDSKTLDGFETVSIVTDSLLEKKDKGNTDKQTELVSALQTGVQEHLMPFNVAYDTINETSGIARFVTATNMKAPVVDGEGTVGETKIKDLGEDNDSDGVTKDHKDLMKSLQEKTQNINPTVGKLLLHMNKELQKLDDATSLTPEATLRNLYKSLGLGDKALASKIFGAMDKSKVTADNVKSKVGQSISKENPMLQLIISAPDFFDADGSARSYSHQLGIYRTGRMEYLATFLNEQMDKSFSRAMVVGDPVGIQTGTMFGDKLLNDMLHSLKDDTKAGSINGEPIDVKHITGEVENEGLDLLVELFQEYFEDGSKDNNVENQLQFLAVLAEGKVGQKGIKFDLGGSVWQQLRVIEAISDIHNKDKDGTIRTTYRTNPDASASGVMLSFMQNVGKSATSGNFAAEDATYAIMRRMGYTTDQMLEDETALNDAYALLLEQVNKAFNHKARPDKKTKQLMDDLVQLGIFKEARDIAKPMTMTTNYQAGVETAVATTSKDLTESVINKLLSPTADKEMVDFMIEKISKHGNKEVKERMKELSALFEGGSYKYAGVAVANVTGVNKAIEAFFTEELSKNMRKYIDAALDPAMDIYKKRVSESFLRLQKVYEEDQRDGSKKDKVPLSIIPAMAWMTMTKAERTYPADINSPEFAAHHSKLLKKYGMPLTSRKQVVVKMKDGTNVIITKEVPNSLTAIVNAIHGIDSAIFFKSHMDTLAEIDTIIKSGKFRGETLSEAEIEGFTTAKQNASGMVHDENNADPYYNAVYVPHYQKNSVEISGEYDVEEQLALTYLSYKDSNGAYDAEGAATMHKEAMKLKDRKLSALKSIPRDSHKFFGFKEGMPESDLGSKTKKDTETETKKEGKKPVHEDMSTPFDPEPEPEATPEPEVEEHEPIFEPPKEETKPEISKEQKEFDRLEQIKNSRINDLDDAKAEHAEAKRKSDAYDDKVADYEIAMEDYIADGSKGQKPYKPRNTGFGTKVAVADQKVNAAQKMLDIAVKKSYEYGSKNDVFSDIDTKNKASDKVDEFDRGTKPDDKYDQFEKLREDSVNEINKEKDREDNGESKEDKQKREDEHFRRIEEAVDYWYDHSPMMKKFIDDRAKEGKTRLSAFYMGNEFAADTAINRMIVPNLDYLKSPLGTYVMDHELVHMNTLAYMEEFTDDKNVKIIDEAVKNIHLYRDDLLTILDDHPFLQARMEYATRGVDPATLRAELVAVLGAEKSVQKAFVALVNHINEVNKSDEVMLPGTRVVLAAKNIAKAVKGIMTGKTKLINPVIDPKLLIEAINNVNDFGQQYNNLMPDSAKAARRKYITRKAELVGKIDKNGYLLDENGNPKKANIRDMKMHFGDLADKATDSQKAEGKKILEDKLGYEEHESYKVDPTQSESIIPGFRQWDMLNNYTGTLSRNYMDSTGEPLMGKGLKNADKWLADNSEVYTTTRKRVADYWNSSDWLQSQKLYLDAARSGDYFAMNKLTTLQLTAEQNATGIQNKRITQINDLIEESRLNGKPLTKKDIADLNRTMAYVPMFHLANDFNDYNRIVGSKNPSKEIDKMIKELSDTMSSNRVRDLQRMGLVLAKKQEPNTGKYSYYNIEQMKITDGGRQNAERLVALYTLKNVDGGLNGIAMLNQNPDLSREMGILSTSVKTIAEDIFSSLGSKRDKSNFRENLMHEQFEDPVEFRVVDMRSINNSDYSAAKGWKTLREPTMSGYGVVYRDRSKVTAQSGTGTTVNFSNYDLMVDPTIQLGGKVDGATEVLNGTDAPGHKVILTQKELNSIPGLLDNPADSLVRAYSQMLLVQDTQSARDYLVLGGKINTQNREEAQKYNKKIDKMKPEDRDWFIKMPANMSVKEYTKRYPEVMIHYKIPEQVSRVGGFNKHFDLVRKDMNDQIMGYKDPELFEGNADLRKWSFVMRQAVTMIKTKWVIVNPAKIANDAISNNIILAAYGLPPTVALRYQKDGFKYGNEMADLRTDLIELEFKIRGYGDKAELKLDKKKAEADRDKLVKKINGHPFAPMYKNGMIQSMSTEILVKDAAVVSGLQKDIEKLFNTYLKKEDGSDTGIAEAIKTFSKAGFDGEQLLKFAGKSLKNFKMLDEFGKSIGTAMEESGDRISQKKKDGDMAKYLSEFIASPDSEAVRLGSYLVQMTDVSSRYAMYKHLMNTRGTNVNAPKTEQEVVIKVLEAFVDYKVNMPKELKVVSDYGVILFPSFWLRIQKVMYAIAKDNPAKVAAGITLSELLSLPIDSYYSSNILAKAGNIVTQPPIFTNPLDAVLPTDLIEQMTLGLL